jgi:hypothetical protein
MRLPINLTSTSSEDSGNIFLNFKAFLPLVKEGPSRSYLLTKTTLRPIECIEVMIVTVRRLIQMVLALK